MADFFADYGIIVSFFVGLSVLGGFIYKTVAGYKQQQNQKEDSALKALAEKENQRLKEQEIKEAIVKKDMEVKDAQTKLDMERRAETLRKDTEALANTVKGTAEDKAAIIKEEIAMTARLLKEHNQGNIETVLAKIKDVDEKSSKALEEIGRVISDLKNQANLTNGNVKKIRREIQALWQTVDEEDGTAQGIKRRRKRERQNENKNREIDEDAEEEHYAKQTL